MTGVGFLAVAAGIGIVASGQLLHVAPLAVWFVAFACAGVTSVLGGEGRSVLGLEWYQLIGIGNVVFAAATILWAVWWASGTTDGFEHATAAGMGLGACCVAWIGVDWLRGAPHFDLANYEPGGIVFG